MKASPSITAELSAVVVVAIAMGALAQSPSHPQALPPQVPRISAIRSSVSHQCAPGQSISVDVRPEHLAFQLSALSFGTEGHGRTDEYAGCDLDVDLDAWFYQWRVAVRDVTYSGRANLTSGVRLSELTARAEFRYIHRENGEPVQQPEVRNLSSSVMIDNVQETTIGGDGDFLDSFEVKSDPVSELVWSPCFDGGEGEGQDTTQLSLKISGTTQDPGDKGEGQFIDGGLTVKFGLAWEECVPDRSAKYAWGDSRTADWETCTYKDTVSNGSTLSTRALPRDVSLRYGKFLRST